MKQETNKIIKTNDKGYVQFSKKNWSFTGDKGTWARIIEGNIFVKRSAKGIISSGFESEMSKFCKENGICWESVRCGDTVKAE